MFLTLPQRWQEFCQDECGSNKLVINVTEMGALIGRKLRYPDTLQAVSYTNENAYWEEIGDKSFTPEMKF